MSLYDKATLVQIPSGYKAADAKLYSVLPYNGDGDFTVSADADATRVNKDGLIESTVANQARLSRNFIDGVVQPDPFLLLEPTRTNLITQSETYTTTSKVNLSVSDNTSISDPQGGANAKTLTATSTSQPRLEWRGTAVPASNTSYAMSFWVRYNTARYVAIAHFSQTGEYAIFDLVDGSVESDVGTQTAKIEKYQNGWYRISKSFQVPSSASLNYWKFTLCTQTNAFLGVSGEKADVFGLQLEVGSYPTSYIPTSGFAVTRTVDNIDNIGGVTVNSDFTYFLHIKNFDDKTLGNFPVQFFLRESASPFSYFRFLLEGNERFYAQLRNNNTATTVFNQFSDTLSNLGDDIKLAFAKSGTNCKYYVNGSLAFSSTITDFNYSFNRVNYSTGNDQPTKLSQIMVFNTALSDSELIALTS